MEVKINKEVIETFKNFWSDPYFVEYLSVNAPDYVTSALVLQACEDFTKKMIEAINTEAEKRAS